MEVMVQVDVYTNPCFSKENHRKAMIKYMQKKRQDENFLIKQREQQMEYYYKNAEEIKKRRREKYKLKKQLKIDIPHE